MKNKNDFIAFLISRRLLKKFIGYWSTGKELNNTKLAFIDYLERTYPGNYICAAFPWMNTKEDNTFWKDLDFIWHGSVYGR